MSVSGGAAATVQIGIAVAAVLGSVPGPTPLPWELWRDLRVLATLPAGDQVALRSSHCPSGCAFDRHSGQPNLAEPGGWRYVRQLGDEGVIFEEAGPGAITRIWMTSGAGTSVPLDPAVRIRFYFDDEETARVDLPLPDLFSGRVAPFEPPLVGDRTVSSGGYVSFVPMPFGRNCRVALVGADAYKLWFQFAFHRLPEGAEVATFTGTEDLAEWVALHAAAGGDPWPAGSGAWSDGRVSIRPGEVAPLLAMPGPGYLTGIRLDVPPAARQRLRLVLRFDGRVTADVPVSDFFAVGRGSATPPRAMFFGVDQLERLVSWYPMPYAADATVALALDPSGDPVTVGYEVRHAGGDLLPGSGRFGSSVVEGSSTPGHDLPLLELARPGRWVGSFVELRSTTPAFLEGDERVRIDGMHHPSIYGTGVEDFFGGGFYFDSGPFAHPLHGMVYAVVENGTRITAAYRQLVTEAVPFGRSIAAGLEAGPLNATAMSLRSTSHYYLEPEPATEIVPVDRFDLGDPESRAAHAYAVSGPFAVRTLEATFEGDPPLAEVAAGVYRPLGAATFVLDGRGCAERMRLRRRYDAGLAGQAATVSIGGEPVGSIAFTDANADRRWRELDLDLPASVSPGLLDITVDANPQNDAGEHSEFRYELWCRRDLLFADGFESADTGRWSQAVP